MPWDRKAYMREYVKKRREEKATQALLNPPKPKKAPKSVEPTEEVRGMYELWPKQADALEMLGLGDLPPTVDELLYGGQAGPGKSFCVRAAAVAIAQKWPGSVVPIFRRTYGELEESHIRKILQEVPSTEAKWNGERRELLWKNGSITEFRHCDLEQHVYRYLSAEWQGLMIDEATTFSPFMISLLRSRVRRPEDPEKRAKLKGDVDSWHPILIYATNPGGESHRYLKEGFVDNEGLGVPWVAEKADGGLRRYFLRARLADNPSLDEEEYQRVLEGIQDPVVRAAMAEGDWSIFGGQFFSQFRYDRHVCAPFQVPDDWLKWTGQDWGITAPSAGTWLARVPPNYPITMTDGSVVRSERPRVVVYREWYQAGLSTDDQAMSLRYYSQNDNLSARYADPHLWDKKGSGGSYAEDFIENGWFIQQANNDRKEGWARIHQMLNVHDMYPPELIIQSQCTTLIKALPEAPRDTNDVEDIDTKYKHDHILDSLRYACMGGRRVMKSMNRNMRGTYRVKGQAKSDDGEDILFKELFGKNVTVMGSRR